MRSLATSVWLGVLIASSACYPAAPPADAARGIYSVGRGGTMLAFRVDPWSEGVYQIRGLGRCTFATEEDTVVYFDIVGTYRPRQRHTAQGVFLYTHDRAGRTSSVPWSGAYDPKTQSFQWGATIDGKRQSLAAARSHPKPAATAPEAPIDGKHPESNGAASNHKLPVKWVSFRKPPNDDLDMFDKDGDIDFSKIITRVATNVPDGPAAAAPSTPPPASDDEGGRDLAIIKALTDLGKGTKLYVPGVGPNSLLDSAIRGLAPRPGDPLRKRAVYPPIDKPRVLQRLTKPGSVQSPPIENLPSLETVPNVVGMKFEDAVNVLWSAGLNPASVECLGHAKDPAQAGRVVSQTPAAGTPYPLDDNMRLQWYTDIERPADPEQPTAPGFQPGDGAKVDGRFAAAKVFANGNLIGGGGGQGGESYNWALYKLDEPMARQAVAGIRPSFAQSSAGAVSTETSEVTVAQKKQSDAEGVLEYSSHDRFKREEIFDRTSYLHYREYRGFLMYYGHSQKGLNQPLGATGTAVMEGSQKLIDLRFPSK